MLPLALEEVAVLLLGHLLANLMSCQHLLRQRLYHKAKLLEESKPRKQVL
jgi:hypothetical protein